MRPRVCQLKSSLFTHPCLGWRGKRKGLSCLGWSGKALVEQARDLGLEDCSEFWKTKLWGRKGMPGGKTAWAKEWQPKDRGWSRDGEWLWSREKVTWVPHRGYEWPSGGSQMQWIGFYPLNPFQELIVFVVMSLEPGHQAGLNKLLNVGFMMHFT